MAVKKKAAAVKAKRMVPLDRRLIKRIASKAVSHAAAEAFEEVETLLAARNGWLVRVDREGKVVKKVKRLPALKRA